MARVSRIARRAVRQGRAGRGDPLRRTDGSPASSFASKASAPSCTGDYYVAALPLEDIAPLVNDRMLAADPTLANLRALAAECGVDERRAVLSAPRCADDARARDSHRHRMGADQHLAAPVLA